MLIYLFMLFKYLCSKEDLVHNDWSIPIVFIWYSRHGDCNIHVITTHCCSNVSIDRIEPMALLIILDLTHCAAWGYLRLIWKHKYPLPAGSNYFVLCKSTGAIVSVVSNSVKQVYVYMAWTLPPPLWCYKWVDVICILGVVLVFIGRNVFIIKLRWYGCLCWIVCRWCMRRWRR